MRPFDVRITKVRSKMGAMKSIRVQVFGVSQWGFAGIAGVMQSTVCRWERGETEPTRGQLARIREEALRRGIEWSDTWFFEVPK